MVHILIFLKIRQPFHCYIVIEINIFFFENSYRRQIRSLFDYACMICVFVYLVITLHFDQDMQHRNSNLYIPPPPTRLQLRYIWVTWLNIQRQKSIIKPLTLLA